MQFSPSASPDLYRVFHVAARELNFSRAAERMHVTQSAISQSIRALETQLGVKLFYRKGRSVHLTEEGEALLPYATRAINALIAGETALRQMKTLESGSVVIGASDTITRFLLIDPIKRFHTLYPGISVSVNNRPSPYSAERLRRGELDLAVVNLLSADHYKDFIARPLWSVSHVFVSADPPKKAAYTIKALAELPIITLESTATTRLILDAYYRTGGISLEPDYAFGSYDVILEAIQARMGIGCIPTFLADPLIESGALHELHVTPPPPRVDVALLISPEKPPSIAAEAFIQLLLEPLMQKGASYE